MTTVNLKSIERIIKEKILSSFPIPLILNAN